MKKVWGLFFIGVSLTGGAWGDVIKDPWSFGELPDPAPAQISPTQIAEDEVLQEGIAALREKYKLLTATVPNKHGALVSALTSAREVLGVVQEAEQLVKQRKYSALKNSTLMRDIYVEAVLRLYTGRGRTGDLEPGWYLNNQREQVNSGWAELTALLRKPGIFDQQVRDYLLDTIRHFDFEGEGVRIQQGFPPSIQILTSEIRSAVIQMIEQLPLAKQPFVEFRGGKLPTVEEMIQSAQAPPLVKIALLEFLGSLERNYYDRSVKVFNDPNQPFIEYYGRAEELRLMTDTIARLEKGHVILSGEAGVGKSTLLKMLSDGYLQGRYRIREELPPLVLELPITDVTNQIDPTAIRSKISLAKLLAQTLGRRVILFVDEGHISTKIVRNAIKSFLAEPLTQEENQVHLVLAATSGEARDFLGDSAFSRRFLNVFVRSFTKEETFALIQKTVIPFWRRYHFAGGVRFADITEDALEFAWRNATYEQPNAALSAGTKELLEGALTRKATVLAEKKMPGDFVVDVDDVIDYLKAAKGIELLAGDPHFDEIFERKWEAFCQDYKGNEGLKVELQQALRKHFSQLDPRKMTAFIFFGAPGAGKTYLAEMLAKHFFAGAVLPINGGEYKNGGLETNKLIGSPVGTVGSEEQRSVLTRFFADHPHGGVIKCEEADYFHQDVLQIFTNMITDKKFSDGLGQEWRTGRYVLIFNSNIGQEYMIPSDSRNRMNWQQYGTRRSQLTERIPLDHGGVLERVRRDRLDTIFDQFVHEIVTQSNPINDTSGVSQEANKQKRRFTPFYVLSPTRDELMEAAHAKVDAYCERVRLENRVQIEVDHAHLEALIAIDRYEFEKGFSYVDEQLEARLFIPVLDTYRHLRGATLQVRFVAQEPSEADGLDAAPRMNVVVSHGGREEVHAVTLPSGRTHNPWYENQETRERIANFASLMRQNLRGKVREIQATKELLKNKLNNWRTRVVVTLLGSTGNGKTQFARALAIALYGTEDAVYKIEGLNNKYQLANYLRPPTGIVGSMQETDFEKWFKSRQHAGGGVILLDELLSYSGLDGHAVSEKNEVFNMLYSLLDEGVISFGNQTYDAQAFPIVITGNALQELFMGLQNDPYSEKLVRKILEKLDRNDIMKYFSERGIDPPKLARLGDIFVDGPLPKSETEAVGKMLLAKGVEELGAQLGHSIDFDVDPEIVHTIIGKMSTNELGMREVNKGFARLLHQPMSGIFSDIPGVRKLEARLVPGSGPDAQQGQRIQWFVNGQEVILDGRKLDESGIEERNWGYATQARPEAENRTPQYADLDVPKVKQFDENAVREVAAHEVFGHWMVSTLLNGRNKDDAISLIPGSYFLGYVMPKEDEVVHSTTLTVLIKRMAELEAGHRAVFKHLGLYSTGGGPGGPRSLKEKNGKDHPKDDVGKVHRIIEAIVNDQLVGQVSEISSPQDKRLVSNLIKRLGVHIADEVIELGLQSGLFSPLYERVMLERFLKGEELDAFVQQLDLNRLGHPDVIFLRAFYASSEAFEAQLRSSENAAQQKKARVILADLTQRVETELQSFNQGHEEILGQLRAVMAQHRSGPEGGDQSVDCEHLLH